MGTLPCGAAHLCVEALSLVDMRWCWDLGSAQLRCAFLWRLQLTLSLPMLLYLSRLQRFSMQALSLSRQRFYFCSFVMPLVTLFGTVRGMRFFACGIGAFAAVVVVLLGRLLPPSVVSTFVGSIEANLLLAVAASYRRGACSIRCELYGLHSYLLLGATCRYIAPIAFAP